MLDLAAEAHFARQAYDQYRSEGRFQLPDWYALDDYDRLYWLKWYPWCGTQSPVAATNLQLLKAYQLYKEAGHTDNFRFLPLEAKAEWLRQAIKRVPDTFYASHWAEYVRNEHSI